MRGAEDRGHRTGRHGFVLYPCPREGGALRHFMETSRPKVYSHFSLRRRGHERGKTPASEEAGRASITLDHSALRRDQISVKLSSPSALTSEA
jgi:hypothetical protein